MKPSSFASASIAAASLAVVSRIVPIAPSRIALASSAVFAFARALNVSGMIFSKSALMLAQSEVFRPISRSNPLTVLSTRFAALCVKQFAR